MAFVLITLTAALLLEVAVVAMLKIGLRNGEAAGNWAGRQPC